MTIHNLNRIALWWLLAALMQAGSLQAAPFQATPMRITLTNGTSVQGNFIRQVGGLFLQTQTGGRQISWQDINPMSLPKDIRHDLQRRLADELARAQQLYLADQVEAAAPIFMKVLRHSHYLDLAAKASPAYADIDYKAQGMVQYGGKWLAFADRQTAIGLIRDGDQWVSREQAVANGRFDAAFTAARLRQDHATTILELLALIRTYPDSDRVPTAEALVTRLTEFLEEQRKLDEEARKAAAQQPAPVVQEVRVVQQVPVEYPYSTWTQTRYSTPYIYNTGNCSQPFSYEHGPRRNGNDHQHRNDPQTRPGFNFKQMPPSVNSGFPFSPPVSVQLTSGHSQQPRNQQSPLPAPHNQDANTPGLNINGQVGGVGVQIRQKDPIRIRF